MRRLPLLLPLSLMVLFVCMVWTLSAWGQDDKGDRLSDEDAVTPEETSSMPTALGLVSVPDIFVETVVGHLPQLPHNIPGVYPEGVKGPKVRVIWPSPKDNSQVLKPGTYTVTGVLPGTNLGPKATVTVKAVPTAGSAPQRKLMPFPLGQVVLNLNEKQQDTQFIKNRDKFVLTLAKTDPDSFLYMFRDAFGEKQPEGVKPLGVWDSQTTKLRGHASGHYLSAVAQAYAGTTYDKQLRANFQQKMDYLIGTLYKLSQKSGKPAEEGGKFNADPTTVPPGPGKDGYNSNLTTEGIRGDYWNWWTRGSSAPTRPTNSSCWRRVPHMAERKTRFGPPIIPSTKSSPVCSIATRLAATKRPWRSPGGWGFGFMLG